MISNLLKVTEITTSLCVLKTTLLSTCITVELLRRQCSCFFCSLSAALLFHTTLTIVIRLLHGLTNRDYVFAQVHDKLIVLIARASQYPIDQWNEIRHRRMSSVHYGHVGRLIAFAHSIIAHTVLSSLRVSLNQSSFSK